MADDDFQMRQLRARQAESKAGFESTQDDLRRNKEQIETLRRENKELKAALQSTARDAGNQSKKSMTNVEIDLLQSKLFQLRRTHDDLKNGNKEVASEIEKMEQRNGELGKEGQSVLDDDRSPLAQKIRTLENRLDKSLIKHNEAVSIRKTYETILKRLQEERVGFDNQLASIEKTLKVKEHDDQELQNMAHDARHAKEMGKAELEEFIKAFEREREQKRDQLKTRNKYVEEKEEQVRRQELQIQQRIQQDQQAQQAAREAVEESERQKQKSTSINDLHTEEEVRRMQEYAESYRKIKEFTRSANKAEVIAKWQELDDTTDTLHQKKMKALARIETLTTQRNELRKKVDDVKYSGSAQLGSRRIVDEFETHLEVAETALNKDMAECERVAKVHAAVKTGVDNLAEMLMTYRAEPKPPVAENANAIVTVEVLQHCEAKLMGLVADVGVQDGEEAENQLDARARVTLPGTNRRVAGASDADAKEDRVSRADMEEGEEDPHSREDLKQMAKSAVERETKKKSKRRMQSDK